MLLTRLPPAWETTIIQTVMAQGTVLGITWDLTKQTILWYWDAEQAKRLRHHSPAAHKLSAIKKYQGPPSFYSQAVPSVGGSSQGKKKKCSSTGKGQKKKFGAVHFTTATSPAVPVTHTIASLMPRGLTQRLEVSEPPSSSFRQCPWTSFNTAMISTDHLQVPKTQRNIQRLEQSLLERIGPLAQCPATPLEYLDSLPPTTAPTSEGGSPIIPERYLPSPPPMAENEGCPFQIRNRPNRSPSPLPNPLWILLTKIGPGASEFPPPHPMQFCPDPGYQPIGGQPMESSGIPEARPLNEPSGYHSDDAVSYGDNESLFGG